MTGPTDYTGQRVLVTGGSSGMGAGLAEALARRGATVGIVARRRDRLGDVLARRPAGVGRTPGGLETAAEPVPTIEGPPCASSTS